MLEQLQRAKTPISLEAPLIDMSRAEIIKLGHRFNTPFDLTYSCREARDVACGECTGCSARAKAFQEAGLLDPAMRAAAPA
jgi:7-cyano-7-deazaguanine synthase